MVNWGLLTIVSIFANKNNNTMLSLEECKKIINAGERQFSYEEVVLIRDFLYELAQIAIEAEACQRQQRQEKIQPQRLIEK